MLLQLGAIQLREINVVVQCYYLVTNDPFRFLDNVVFVSNAFAIAVAPSSPMLLSPRISSDNVVFVSNAFAIVRLRHKHNTQIHLPYICFFSTRSSILLLPIEV